MKSKFRINAELSYKIIYMSSSIDINILALNNLDWWCSRCNRLNISNEYIYPHCSYGCGYTINEIIDKRVVYETKKIKIKPNKNKNKDIVFAS